MTDYTKLVKALRCKRDDCEGCDLAFFDKDEGWMCQYAAKDDDAADAIEELLKVNRERTELYEDAVKQMPKRGKWVKGTDGLYHCSKCGKTAPYLDAFDGVIQYWEPLFFCNNCGADMRAKMEVQE